MWQGSKYARIIQGFKYATVWLDISEKMCICLNMSKFTIIDRVLNMSHTIHSTRSLYKLMSTYCEIGVFKTLLKI